MVVRLFCVVGVDLRMRGGAGLVEGLKRRVGMDIFD